MENQEKTTNKIKLIVRIIALILLTFGAIFRIAIPWFKNAPVYLDRNDGYIFGIILIILLYFEAIKPIVDKFIKK